MTRRPPERPSGAPKNGGGVSAAGRRAAVELKGLSHPILRAVLREADTAAIRLAVEALAEEGRDGFEWQAVVVDLTALAEDSPLELETVCALLRGLKLHPVAIAGGGESVRLQADALQLGWLSALAEPRRTPSEAAAAPEPGAPASVVPTAEASASMTVERPIRSGQQIYARGADLVVIGPVSPGAEVIADGNVHVYGALQGRAIAGARGRRDVGVFALDFRAELVAVSGIYRTFEEGVPPEFRGRPVRVALDGGSDKLSVLAL